MSKNFFDYDDGDYAHSISDNSKTKQNNIYYLFNPICVKHDKIFNTLFCLILKKAQ